MTEKNQIVKDDKTQKKSKPHKESIIKQSSDSKRIMNSAEKITEFKTKVNEYGFMHVPKEARTSLPFKVDETLKVKIEGKVLVITRASKEIQKKN